jgi:glycosyltransferase involved in cell wall biosynthesis
MKSNKITIITVVYNGEKTLEKTIQSVAKQIYQNIEYIIIDGGSNDKTLDIIKKYEKHIDYWISEPDKGIYDAMNKGAKKATGDYIYFLNADDYIHDERVLENINKEIINKKNPDLIYGVVVKVYSDYNVEVCNDLNGAAKGLMPPHQGSFFKTKVFRELGGFNISYKSSGDFEFYVRYYLGGYKSCKVGQKIAYFQSGGTSSIKSVSTIETYDVLKKYFGILSAFKFRFRKIILEQGIKKILLSFKLDFVYHKMAKLNNKKQGVNFRNN